MIIIGAGGFAKEVLSVLHSLNTIHDIALFDNLTPNLGETLYGYPVLNNFEAVKTFFSGTGSNFTIGIGNPQLRYEMSAKFAALGGTLVSTISCKANISPFGVEIGKGCNILDNALLSNDSSLGEGCIVYYNVTVTHDCKVGNYVELSPGAILLGRSKIGSYTKIGANATILPKISIGENVQIGAGSVVTRDIPDNCLAVGAPAKIIKQNLPFHF